MRPILVFIFAVHLIGCGSKRERKPHRIQEATTQAAVSSPKLEYVVTSPTITDFEVLEVVLSDLLRSPEFQGYPARGGSKTQIVLDLRTIQNPYPLDGAKDVIDRMAEKGLTLTDDLVRDFIRRSYGSISLDGFSTRNPNILITDVEIAVPKGRFGIELEFPKAFPSAKGWVHTRLPGYSADGQYAYVECRLHPAEHGASANYLLRKENGRWTVSWRRVAYFA
jgi:hypothetical protein